MTAPTSQADDRIIDVWGPRTPHGPDEPWPDRRDQYLTVDETAVERWVQSACVMCSNGCGLDIAVADGEIVGVRGRTEDRINHGRLGPKGLFSWQANNSPDRLRNPLLRVDGELRPTDWDTAMSTIVAHARLVIDEYGPSATGFYTSGQLFAEEYYTQALAARGGIGTNHLDGNTRLCTATSEWALVESFGSDGDPGSYGDLDCCDTLFLVGHNMAETQTVLWARVLDRLHGPDRPRLVVVDPRTTPTARAADCHVALRPGTNVPFLNGVLHEFIAHGHVDRAFIDDHTVGYEALAKVVESYPPERVSELCGISADTVRRAAEILGTGDRLVSTVLQGVYQSHQATAAAVQVNNVNLLRGMIGEPGCTVFQMNGQPTAENTREAGADGSLPGYRNWQNDSHVRDLAELWNVDVLQIPHWGPPTHAMQMFRYIENGSIRFFWITGTNPAVSLPELARIRSVVGDDRLFLVVSDAYLSETAALADVVLPAALWSEKTGTFTNADRTVHLSEQAVEPPGEARSDLHAFIDFARRLNLVDRDGAPLVPWSEPEEAFAALTRMTKGRPLDQSALTYEALRGGSGIQWPVTETSLGGTERLYADHHFPTEADVCESYGHDLSTGALSEADEYRAHDPQGRAMLKAAEWEPLHEPVDDDHRFQLTTGRNVYQFHTRTKTGRAPQLHEAAPEVWAELCAQDATDLDVTDGDRVEISSPRGSVVAKVAIGDTRPGVVFLPFHYGYWDHDDGVPTAANELTRTDWDPVSKQPVFKVTKVAITKVTDRAAQRRDRAGTGAS